MCNACIAIIRSKWRSACVCVYVRGGGGLLETMILRCAILGPRIEIIEKRVLWIVIELNYVFVRK